MKSMIAIFEIPAKDINRAVHFYETLLGISIKVMDFQGMKMGVFPSEDQLSFGTIVEGEGNEPSVNGVTIYLNMEKDIEGLLSLVGDLGGTVLVEKSPHADESGYYGLFIDSEGNKIGLNNFK
ncbi:hypothetical protein QE109_08405 [Fusibacter bizertensis]|uniref:Glyoxalase/fosfomycin resistance/dioxygenase domain-containing protein n=1 Tax=Fusibacter bizertensis TaxID=1488331 RepID=A0ABT6NCL7_9FIRM|nr:VOC family protein [Fusibacter bizertensis]MDH8678166.1 hypothetical protein [Fusibacter bizertensis]